MQIKDVEKITGLTQKSIRYYESKGLLNVKRDQSNDYRDYTEADVEVLRRIKCFRYLEFSLEEIRELLKLDEEAIRSKLNQKVTSYENNILDCHMKQDLCQELIKTGDYSALDEMVDLLGSEEGQEVKHLLIKSTIASRAFCILMTLIWLGPIGGLFIKISQGIYEHIIPWMLVSMIGVLMIEGTWRGYVRNRKVYKEMVKEENRKVRFVLPAMVLIGVVALFLICGMDYVQRTLICDEDFLFFEMPGYAMIGIMCLLIFGLFFVLGWIFDALNIKGLGDIDELIDIVKDLGAVKWCIPVIYVLLIYVCMTSINCVTNDSIIIYRPWDIGGTTYAYTDAKQVETGFGQRGISISQANRKGEFYYSIDFDDRTVTFTMSATPAENERYEDSHLWFEDLDNALMALGVEKISDEQGVEYVVLDQRYIDRFLSIIKKTPTASPTSVPSL